MDYLWKKKQKKFRFSFEIHENRLNYNLSMLRPDAVSSSAVCRFRCMFNEYFECRTLPQMSQTWFFDRSGACLAAMCRFRPSFWRNLTPQWLHGNGFSPVSDWIQLKNNNKCFKIRKNTLIQTVLVKKKLTSPHMEHQRFALRECFSTLLTLIRTFTRVNELKNWQF